MARAARRWPPKRCRIIPTGQPIATPVDERSGPAVERAACSPAPVRSLAPARGPMFGSRMLRWPPPHEVVPVGVEYLVRAAKITDVERLVALSDSSSWTSEGGSPLNASDLLRQLVYLPQASVVVAEARRELVGGAVLALRPSVRAGGFVGTVDLLVVDPSVDADRVTAALLEEVLRSARNKGCAIVEAAAPTDPVERTHWESLGFREAGPRLFRSVAVAKAATRQS